MDNAFSGSTSLVGYISLFAAIGLAFVFVNLLVGRFLRPADPHAEKLEIYECGEPAIGSSYVQFDLRFYVVALIFIVFDVEVAFLFPWATVFGKANLLVQSTQSTSATAIAQQAALMQELGVPAALAQVGDVAKGSMTLLRLAAVEVLVFFLILLVGFAYVWKMGALDWVRALTTELRRHRERELEMSTIPERRQTSVLSA